MHRAFTRQLSGIIHLSCRGLLGPFIHRLTSRKRAPEWEGILLRDAEFRILLCEFRYPEVRRPIQSGRSPVA